MTVLHYDLWVMRFSFGKVLVSSLLIFSSFVFLSSNTYTLDSRSHGPLIKNKNGTSTNWSGYAVHDLGSSTDVVGTWTIPQLSCTSQNAYSSSWVGLDGYSSSSVEQIGTEHDCLSGSDSYYAWFEMYPKPGYKTPLAVKPGDVVTGQVTYLGRGNFQLTLVNNTTHKSFSTKQKMNKAQLSSAEWITEAPWSGGVLPLANFVTEDFSAGSATVNNSNGVIGSYPQANVDRIDMIQSDGVTLKDQTSSLNTAGDSFSISWMNY